MMESNEPNESTESTDVEMSLWDHLEELRRRIIISAIAIGVFTVLSLSFSKPIEKVIMFPLGTSMNTLIANAIDATIGSEGSIWGFFAITMRAGTSNVNAELMKVGPVEAIMAFLKLGITTGILLALPIVIYQVWAFVFPALNRQERRFAVPALPDYHHILRPRCCLRLLYCHTRRTTVLRRTVSRYAEQMGFTTLYQLHNTVNLRIWARFRVTDRDGVFYLVSESLTHAASEKNRVTLYWASVLCRHY